VGRSGLRRASEREFREGSKEFTIRADLGKELEELVGMGVMLRYGRVGGVSVGDMSGCGCYTQRGAYGDWKAIP